MNHARLVVQYEGAQPQGVHLSFKKVSKNVPVILIVSVIENMNLVRMVNERFHMIRGEEEMHCINWVEMFLHSC